MTGHTAHINIGTEQLCTAILTKGTIVITAQKLPNGNGIAAM
jgi:hypothetical protein